MVKEIKTYLIAASLIIVALIICGTLVLLNLKNLKGDIKTVESFGESKIEIKANKASIIVSYEARAKTAEEAQKNNKEVSVKIILNLKNNGLKEEEIETLSYYVNPQYDWKDGKQIFREYLAVHTLKISTTDINKIGSYIDAAMTGGANRIDSINYELTKEKENELKEQVLKEAAENARNKAEAIATGSGSKIKKLVSIQDTSFNYQPWVYRVDYVKAQTAELKIPTEVETGKITIQANVKAVFEIN